MGSFHLLALVSSHTCKFRPQLVIQKDGQRTRRQAAEKSLSVVLSRALFSLGDWSFTGSVEGGSVLRSDRGLVFSGVKI